MKFNRMAIVILTAVVALGLLIGLFSLSQRHRDNNLSTQAQKLVMPAGCKQSSKEFIHGEFMPLDEILLEKYDCSTSMLTVDETARFFTDKGLSVQYPELKDYRYILTAHKDGYYLKVSLNDKATSGSAKLVTIRYYTGFGTF